MRENEPLQPSLALLTIRSLNPGGPAMTKGFSRLENCNRGETMAALILEKAFSAGPPQA
jgi:hypothetical protein